MPAFAGLELTTAGHGRSSEQPIERRIQAFPNQRVKYPHTGAVHIRGQFGFKNNNKRLVVIFFFIKKWSENLFCMNKYVNKTGFSKKRKKEKMSCD